MDDDDRADFVAASSYITCTSTMKPLRNVWVSPESVVYKNGSLLTETLASKEQISYYRLRHLAKKIFVGQKITLHSQEKYLLATDSWSAGHFHWFCDVLPKLIGLGSSAGEFTLLLPDSNYTRNIAPESLQRLGLRFEDIVWMNERSFYFIKNLFCISKVSRSGQMHKGLMKELQQRFTQGCKSSNRRIYISRQKAKFRKIVNEEMLISLLRSYGFEILHAEDLSLEDQVSVFSSAQTICGIHGAGLTNCLFMPIGGKVIELRKKENGPSNVAYWHLADAVGHSYYYYNGIPDSDKPLVGKGCNLMIPVHDFEEKVLKVL